jgi:hypothetical protein
MKTTKLINNDQQLAIVETNITVLDVLMKDKDGNFLATQRGSNEYYSNDPDAIRKALAKDAESSNPNDQIMSMLVRGLLAGKTIHTLEV